MLVEFTCEICEKAVRKHWSKSMPGRPRFCCWDCKSESQRRQKPVSKEWLHQKYIVEGLGAPEIAKLVNRHPKRVWEWLRDLGIPTRPRGSDDRVYFKKGAPSAFRGRRHSDETREKARQARLRDGHVPYLKDGVHYSKGKRGAEIHSWKGGLTPARQQLYGTPEWKAIAHQVWKHAFGTCQRCGMTKKEASEAGVMLDIHHIVGFEVEALRCSLANLVLLCEPCHYFVHSRKNEKREFLR